MEHLNSDLEQKIRKLENENQKLKEKIITLIADTSKNQLEFAYQVYSENELQELLLKIASRFIAITPEELDNNINYTLKEIGRFVNADRSYIFNFDSKTKLCNNTYEWCNDDIAPEIDNLQNILLADEWVEAFKSNKPIFRPNVETLEDGLEKEILSSQNIISVIAFPLIFEKDCVGFVGFDSVRNHRNYTEIEQKLLALFADMLVNIKMKIKSEKVLQESKEQLNLALKVAKMGYWDYDIQTNKVFWSKGHNELFGLENGELSQKLEDIKKLIYQDDIQSNAEKYFYAIENDLPFDNTYRVVYPDGSIHWLHSYGLIYKNEKGVSERMFGVSQDITDKKLEAEELISQNNLLEGIINGSTDILSIQLPDHTIVKYNQAAYKYLKNIPENPVGFKCYNLIGRDVVCENCPAVLALKTKKLSILEKYIPELGAYFDCRANPILDANGNVVFIVEQLRDITENKKNASELLEAKEQAEESDRLKSAFLQNMSHEIRTPLNAILGFSSLINTGNLSKIELDEYSDIIKNSSKRLIEIVDNVLALSMIETGQMKIQKQLTSINNVISELYLNFSKSAINNSNTINYELELNEDDSSFWVDKDKVSKILYNLIHNAIKFTQNGIISFGYTYKNGELEFWVKDTGRGIDTEHSKRIFERFYQIDHSITRGYEGAGLGLSLSYELVQLLGGKIWLESEVNKGTKIYFTIPV